MKPYQQIPIIECGEPLVPIPLDRFAVTSPHPYEQLGAPYGDRSPFFLRPGVLDRLQNAQTHLQHHHPHWRIQIFDAYRPVEVQQYMVDYSFNQLVTTAELSSTELTPAQRQTFQEQVHQFWAVPSLDPATPPPHSTGAAVDVTLIDAENRSVEMGSPIDEISPRSYPDYFAHHGDPAGIQYQIHRQILAQAMRSAGFQQHPNEWWHFSFGDQLWAWLSQSKTATRSEIARYGRVS
jgi:zinc D-Ala-D-Ala dipeptidase